MPLKILREDHATLNLTPMIDIIFLLLIFFIFGTRFSELNTSERDLSLQVPEVSSMGVPSAAAAKRLINVFDDGRVELDGAAIELDALATTLAAARRENPKVGVVVRGDSGSPYQRVAEVIAACHQAQITDLNIAVRVAARQTSPER